MNLVALAFCKLICVLFLFKFVGFLVMSMRLVLQGRLANLYSMVWVMCLCNIGVMVPFAILSIASEYIISFSMIQVWPLTFWMVTLCQNHAMCCTTEFIWVVVLGGWPSYMQYGLYYKHIP